MAARGRCCKGEWEKSIDRFGGGGRFSVFISIFIWCILLDAIKIGFYTAFESVWQGHFYLSNRRI